jgi:hypothetical protein
VVKQQIKNTIRISFNFQGISDLLEVHSSFGNVLSIMVYDALCAPSAYNLCGMEGEDWLGLILYSRLYHPADFRLKYTNFMRVGQPKLSGRKRGGRGKANVTKY